MRWETAVAIVLAPLAADLLRRYEMRLPPFGDSWTIAKVIRPLIGKKANEWSASGAQIGGEGLRALPPPVAHEVIGQEPTVEGTRGDRGSA